MTTRIYFTKDVIPGMRLAVPAVGDDGTVLLAENTVLTSAHIDRLLRFGVRTVRVYANFNDIYADTLEIISDRFSNIRYFKEVPLPDMEQLAACAIEPMIESAGIINNLLRVRVEDDPIFKHSLNVAVISGMIAKWLGLDAKTTKEVILGALLHDIGKTQVPLEIINKPGHLSTEETLIIQLHPFKGAELLENSDRVSPNVVAAILQHHEKIDGSGYPYRLTGEQIQLPAKIIAVADIYDAMTSERTYNRKRTPFEVMEVVSQDMFNKLDVEVCTTFLRNVTDYFIGNIVQLSNGDIAEVIMRGNFQASRPLVRTDDGKIINLETEKGIAITALVHQ